MALKIIKVGQIETGQCFRMGGEVYRKINISDVRENTVCIRRLGDDELLMVSDTTIVIVGRMMFVPTVV